ncbi:helix-turn-helix transcriptional regulator [Clostridium sp. C8-1-8]|uniref:helix-turn-helix transcriptional regulator n=1 Tax=Clostridium sp. C8-1-8 TaxID=2698831 RepID=UPI00136DD3E3|nr:helix-turn-helix transcriptional regulator [Clostridium sp. C8-1-8]
MEFYNPSEKIKLMRKKFRVNQSELEDVNMTRAFISMMESGKRNVSKASSKLLAEKFNRIASRIAVKLELDDEYFSRTPKADAIYYCEKQLEDDITHNELKDLIKIASDFKLDELLARMYKLDGEKYFTDKDYKNAFLAFRKSIGKYKELRDNIEQIDLYLSLGKCKASIGDHEDAIHYFEEAIAYSLEEGNKKTYYRANVNLAISYTKTKQYQKCLDILEKYILLEKEEMELDVIVRARVTKANVLYESKEYEKALNEYLELVDIVDGIDEIRLAVLYNNIAECFYELNDYDNSLKYIDMAQQIKVRISKESLAHTLNTKAKILFRRGLHSESILIFKLAIDLAEQFKNFEALIECYKDLVLVYESINDDISIQESMNKLLETLEFYDIECGKAYAILKLAEVSARDTHNKETVDLLNKLEVLLK